MQQAIQRSWRLGLQRSVQGVSRFHRLEFHDLCGLSGRGPPRDACVNGNHLADVRPGNTSLVERVEDRPAFGAQGMRGADLKIASEQALGLSRYGVLHMNGKERHTDQRADPDRDADKEIQKVAPGPPSFTPGHAEHEEAQDAFSQGSVRGRISSDSMRPSRRAITRCIKLAMARSCVTSTKVVP